VLPPEKVLAPEIAKCIADTGSFYSLTFDPPPTTARDEYHAFAVKLSDPNLTATTVSGYFDEPFYRTTPDAELRRVSVAELQQIISAHKATEKLPVSSLRLNERLSAAKVAELETEIHLSKERAALDSIADLSVFLPPPAADIPSDPPPDTAGQQKILTAVEEYLNHTISKLPDFFATRGTVHYGETTAYEELKWTGGVRAPDRTEATST